MSDPATSIGNTDQDVNLQYSTSIHNSTSYNSPLAQDEPIQRKKVTYGRSKPVTSPQPPSPSKFNSNHDQEDLNSEEDQSSSFLSKDRACFSPVKGKKRVVSDEEGQDRDGRVDRVSSSKRTDALEVGRNRKKSGESAITEGEGEETSYETTLREESSQEKEGASLENRDLQTLKNLQVADNRNRESKTLENRSSPSDLFEGSISSAPPPTSSVSNGITDESDRPFGPGFGRKLSGNDENESESSSDDDDEEEDESEEELQAFAGRMKPKNKGSSTSSKKKSSNTKFKSIASRIMDSEDSESEAESNKTITKTSEPKLSKEERLKRLRERKIEELRLQNQSQDGSEKRGLKSSSPVDEDILEDQDQISMSDDGEETLLSAFDVAQKGIAKTRELQKVKDLKIREMELKRMEEEDRLSGSDLGSDSGGEKKKNGKGKGKAKAKESKKVGGKERKKKKKETVKKPRSLPKAELEKMQADIARLERTSKKTFRDLKNQKLDEEEVDSDDEVEGVDDQDQVEETSRISLVKPKNKSGYGIFDLAEQFAAKEKLASKYDDAQEEEEEEDEIRDFDDSSSDRVKGLSRAKGISGTHRKIGIPSTNSIQSTSRSFNVFVAPDSDIDGLDSSFKGKRKAQPSSSMLPMSSNKFRAPTQTGEWKAGLPKLRFVSNTQPKSSSKIASSSASEKQKMKSKAPSSEDFHLSDEDSGEELEFLDLIQMVAKKEAAAKALEDQMIKDLELAEKKEKFRQMKLDLVNKQKGGADKKNLKTAAKIIEDEKDQKLKAGNTKNEKEKEDDLEIVKSSRSPQQMANPSFTYKQNGKSNGSPQDLRTTNNLKEVNSGESLEESMDLWTESQFKDEARYGHGTRLGASGGGIKLRIMKKERESQMNRSDEKDFEVGSVARKLNFGEDEDQEELEIELEDSKDGISSTDQLQKNRNRKSPSSSRSKAKHHPAGGLTQRNMNDYVAKQIQVQNFKSREKKEREAGIKKKVKKEKEKEEAMRLKENEDAGELNLAETLKRAQARANANLELEAQNAEDDEEEEDGDFKEEDYLRGSGSEDEREAPIDVEETKGSQDQETEGMDLDQDQQVEGTVEEDDYDEEGKENAPPSSQDPAPFRNQLPTGQSDDEDEEDEDLRRNLHSTAQRRIRRRQNQILSDDEEDENGDANDDQENGRSNDLSSDGRRDESPTPHQQLNRNLISLDQNPHQGRSSLSIVASTSSPSSRNPLQVLSPEQLRSRSTQPLDSEGKEGQEDVDYPQLDDDGGRDSTPASLGNWFAPTGNDDASTPFSVVSRQQPTSSIRHFGMEKSDSEVMGQFFSPTQNETDQGESLDILGHLKPNRPNSTQDGGLSMTQLFEQGTPMERDDVSSLNDGFEALRKAEGDGAKKDVQSSALPTLKVSVLEDEEDDEAQQREEALMRQERINKVNQTPKQYLGKNGLFTQTKPTSYFDDNSQSESQDMSQSQITPLWKRNGSVLGEKRDREDESGDAGNSPSQLPILKRFRRGGKPIQEDEDEEDEEEETGKEPSVSSATDNPSIDLDSISEARQKKVANVFESMMKKAREQPNVGDVAAREEAKKASKRFLQDQADESDEEDDGKKKSKTQGGLAGIFDDKDDETGKKDGEEEEDEEDDGKDLEGLVDDEKDEDEKIKDALVREQHRLDEEARDLFELQKVQKITDGLHRQKKGRENLGGEMDDFLDEDYDDEDMRRRASAIPGANKRKIDGGDGLDDLAKNEESRAFVTTYQGTHAKDQDKEYPFLDAPDVDQDSDSDSDEEMEDAEDDDHSMQKVSAQEARAKLQERARKRKRNEVISDDEDQQDSENKEEDEDQGKGRNEWDSDEDEDLTKGILNDRIAVKRAEKNVIAKKNAYLNNNPKTITADDDEEDPIFRLLKAPKEAPRSAKEKERLVAWGQEMKEDTSNSRIKMGGGGGGGSISSFTNESSRPRKSAASSTSTSGSGPVKNPKKSKAPKRASLHKALGGKEGKFVESQ